MGVKICRGGGGIAAGAGSAACLLLVDLPVGSHVVVGYEYLIEVVCELEGIVGGESAGTAFCGHGSPHSGCSRIIYGTSTSITSPS